MAKSNYLYVCSPLSAPTQAEIEKNMKKAKCYMSIIESITGKRAIAPHAILPGYFDDNIPEEREICLKFGLDVLSHAEGMVVCGKRISSGMIGEITRAMDIVLPIYTLVWDQRKNDFDMKCADGRCLIEKGGCGYELQ